MYLFIFILFLIETPVSKQCRPDQMPRFAAVDLGLRCLLLGSHLWITRHIWVNFGICSCYVLLNTGLF